MHSLIDEARRIPSIERISFTGGECFLLGAELDGLVAHANQLGLSTRVITNCYWAVNVKAARGRVASLRGAGLSEMMISTGTFHQHFVPIERVIQAARAAATASIPVRIAIEACDQQTFDESVLHEQLAAEIASRNVFLGHDPWTTDAGGRGTEAISHNDLLALRGAVAAGGCAQILDIVTVTPDQELLACCGFPLEQLPSLRIGSVARDALNDVLRNAPNQLMQLWLHIAGPQGIAQFVSRYLPGYELPPMVSVCQSCVALQRDTRAMAILWEHGHEVIDSVLNSFVDLSGGLEPLRAF